MVRFIPRQFRDTGAVFAHKGVDGLHRGEGATKSRPGLPKQMVKLSRIGKLGRAMNLPPSHSHCSPRHSVITMPGRYLIHNSRRPSVAGHGSASGLSAPASAYGFIRRFRHFTYYQCTPATSNGCSGCRNTGIYHRSRDLVQGLHAASAHQRVRISCAVTLGP